MSDDQPNIKNQAAEEKRKKQERLSEALRANLKRRKTQTRARKTIEPVQKGKT